MSSALLDVQWPPDGWTHMGGPSLQIVVELEMDDEWCLRISDACDTGDLDEVLATLNLEGPERTPDYVGVCWGSQVRAVAKGVGRVEVTENGTAIAIVRPDGDVAADVVLPDGHYNFNLRMRRSDESDPEVPDFGEAAGSSQSLLLGQSGAGSVADKPPVAVPSGGATAAAPAELPSPLPESSADAARSQDPSELPAQPVETALPARPIPTFASARTPAPPTGSTATAFGRAGSPPPQRAEAAEQVSSDQPPRSRSGLPAGQGAERFASLPTWGAGQVGTFGGGAAASPATPAQPLPDQQPPAVAAPADPAPVAPAPVAPAPVAPAPVAPASPTTSVPPIGEMTKPVPVEDESDATAAYPPPQPAPTQPDPARQHAPAPTGANPTPHPATGPGIEAGDPGDEDSAEIPSYEFLFGQTSAIELHRPRLSPIEEDEEDTDLDPEPPVALAGPNVGLGIGSGQVQNPHSQGQPVTNAPQQPHYPPPTPDPAIAFEHQAGGGGLISSVPWATPSTATPPPAPAPVVSGVRTPPPAPSLLPQITPVPPSTAPVVPPTAPVPPGQYPPAGQYAAPVAPVAPTQPQSPAAPSQPPISYDPYTGQPIYAPPAFAPAPAPAATPPAQPAYPAPTQAPVAVPAPPAQPAYPPPAMPSPYAQAPTVPTVPTMPTVPTATEELIAPTVMAVLCPLGHPSPPHQPTCRQCGAQIPPQDPFPMPRPTLGRLVLSTGDVVPLDRSVLLGRAPKVNESIPVARRPHVVKVPSPQKDVSRNHLEVSLEGWLVLVRDLGATNGSTVQLPGHAPMRLGTHQTEPIQPGTFVSLADEVTFTFEVGQ